MHFYNKTFENIYLSIIAEQSGEGVQFKYICKDCNTGFTEDDGFAEGDACPCEDCDGKLEECVIDDLDPNNMPAQYQANNDQDKNLDTDQDKDDKDLNTDQDEVDKDEQDDDFQDDDFCDDQDEDLQDDDFQDEDLQDDDFQDDDFQDDLCDDQDEDLDTDQDKDSKDFDTDQDEDDKDEQDDDFQDEQAENADDEAAAEDTNEQNTEEEQPETKLVSFTAEDPALIELLTQVQNGEIKLVAVPVDFEFEEKEMNEQPAITMDTVGNFAIDDMNEEQEGEENAEGEAEGEENAEGEEQEIAKEAKKKFSTMSKPTKYGIY